MVTWSTRNLLIATILLAAIVGSVTGLGTSYLAHPSPTPQTRNIYLFAQDPWLQRTIKPELRLHLLVERDNREQGRHRDHSLLQSH